VPEDRALLEYHRTGSRDAREEAIERYIPLARSLARRYVRRGEPIEDLEQVACLALVKAVDAFDPTKGAAFSSYAVPCLTGAIKRHFRDHGWAVRVPRALQELALRVNHVTEELTSETGRVPTPAQVAEQVGVDVEEVLSAREAFTALHAESIHQPRRATDDGGLSLLETLPDGDRELPRAFDRVVLEELLEGLGERERTIIHLYYREELTQAEIGRRIGYSQMHISRMLRRAEEKLQRSAQAA
jgi:RNA polymerase sigma-B factor